jgi:hypothetical protein
MSSKRPYPEGKGNGKGKEPAHDSENGKKRKVEIEDAKEYDSPSFTTTTNTMSSMDLRGFNLLDLYDELLLHIVSYAGVISSLKYREEEYYLAKRPRVRKTPLGDLTVRLVCKKLKSLVDSCHPELHYIPRLDQLLQEYIPFQKLIPALEIENFKTHISTRFLSYRLLAETQTLLRALQPLRNAAGQQIDVAFLQYGKQVTYTGSDETANSIMAEFKITPPSPSLTSSSSSMSSSSKSSSLAPLWFYIISESAYDHWGDSQGRFYIIRLTEDKNGTSYTSSSSSSHRWPSDPLERPPKKEILYKYFRRNITKVDTKKTELLEIHKLLGSFPELTNKTKTNKNDNQCSPLPKSVGGPNRYRFKTTEQEQQSLDQLFHFFNEIINSNLIEFPYENSHGPFPGMGPPFGGDGNDSDDSGSDSEDEEEEEEQGFMGHPAWGFPGLPGLQLPHPGLLTAQQLANMVGGIAQAAHQAVAAAVAGQEPPPNAAQILLAAAQQVQEAQAQTAPLLPQAGGEVGGEGSPPVPDAPINMWGLPIPPGANFPPGEYHFDSSDSEEFDDDEVDEEARVERQKRQASRKGIPWKPPPSRPSLSRYQESYLFWGRLELSTSEEEIEESYKPQHMELARQFDDLMDEILMKYKPSTALEILLALDTLLWSHLGPLLRLRMRATFGSRPEVISYYQHRPRYGEDDVSTSFFTSPLPTLTSPYISFLLHS